MTTSFPETKTGLRLGFAAAVALALFAGSPARADDKVLAKVNGVEIKESDVALAEEELAPSLQQMDPATRKDNVLGFLIDLQIVARNADVKGFQVLPRRWVVERTFAWLGRCRRLARDYERKPAHAEAMIKVAMIRLMAARLAGEDIEPQGPIETEAARRLDDELNQK